MLGGDLAAEELAMREKKERKGEGPKRGK